MQNALLLGLGGGIAFVISIAMAVSLDFLIDHTIELEKRFGEATYERSLVSSILVGVFSAFIVLPISVFLGLRYGGIACLQHLILRVLLWHYDFAPWRYVQFLN